MGGLYWVTLGDASRKNPQSGKLFSGDMMEKKKRKPDKPHKEPPGPKPKRLKLEGDWGKAIKKAVKKKRPPKGWDDQEKEPPDKA